MFTKSYQFFALGALSTVVLASPADLTFSSLYLPDFDPQPISVVPLGAGSDGRTTYLVGPGVATNTDDTPFPATGTVIEGPNDVVQSFVIPGPDGAPTTIVQSCAISGTSAHCLVGDGQTFSMTLDDLVTPIQVQVAATPAPTPSSGSASSPGSSVPSSAQQTPSGASQTPSPTGGNNSGAVSVSTASHAVVLAAFGVALALF